MLTADLVRPRLRCTAGELTIALLDEHKRSWLQTASELIALLRRQVGHTRAEWEQAVDAYAGTRVDYVVVRGLAKVLSDAATFTPPLLPLPPAALRERLFAHGPAFPTPQGLGAVGSLTAPRRPLPPAALRARLGARGPSVAAPGLAHPRTRAAVVARAAAALGLGEERGRDLLHAQAQLRGHARHHRVA